MQKAAESFLCRFFDYLGPLERGPPPRFPGLGFARNELWFRNESFLRYELFRR